MRILPWLLLSLRQLTHFLTTSACLPRLRGAAQKIDAASARFRDRTNWRHPGAKDGQFTVILY
jgi:hypothetical protein